MELYVLDRWEAESFDPPQQTYAIRIFSSYEPRSTRGHLRYSELYKKVAEYVFDDNDEHYKAGSVTITPEIADIIVQDFARHKDSVDILMVHCTQGRNRSPAVAIALNEAFNLGFNTSELKCIFKEYNQYVYKIVSEACRRFQNQ